MLSGQKNRCTLFPSPGIETLGDARKEKTKMNKRNTPPQITVEIERPELMAGNQLLADALATVAKMHTATRERIARALAGACGYVHTGGRHVAACTANGASGQRIALITGTGPDWR